VALVLDVTATLAHPQLWLDVVLRLGQGAANTEAPARKQERSAEHREATISAYAIIEALAREGHAEQGRGFVFYGARSQSREELFCAS